MRLSTKAWLSENGVEAESLGKKDVAKLIDDTDGQVEEALRLRLQLAKSSVKKYQAMLSSVKDSIINAYEIKTGLSRAKLSHLMDAETWMDAHKAVELGFADGILGRTELPEDMDPPAVTMLYSKAAVVNSLMDKIAAKCKTKPKTELEGRSVDSLYERLDLLRF